MRFADINLSEAPIRGAPYNPGAGGWPTIRYFNKETGEDGAPYDKKTDKPMCEELGNLDAMVAYIEEAGGTSLCALDGKGCDERSLAYLEKMKGTSKAEVQAQLEKLEGFKDGAMNKELREWVNKRKKIVKNVLAAYDDRGEL